MAHMTSGARRSPAETRTQQDPLQPEVTAEEEQIYEARYHGNTRR
ncbi:hypothetical protein AAFP35_12245 [Gordonia sp. CPCC 206044]